MTGSGVIVAGERRRSVAEITDRAARAATGLRALGLGEGGALAVHLRNDFEFFEASMAAARLGAYATPVNWHFTAEEAGYILRDSGARAVITHSDLYPTIAAAVPEGVTVLLVDTPPEILAAYRLPPPSAAPSDVMRWDALIAANPPLADPPPLSRGAMIYTSGTTGRPKGVRRSPFTPERLAAFYRRMEHTFGLKAGEPTIALMNGPMYHSAPNTFGLHAFRLGHSLVLQPRFDAEEMLALIERHRITNMHIVPTMFVRLLRLPEAVRKRYDVSSLRFVVHGAAPCPAEIKQAMLDWWGPVITEYYGSTEGSVPVIATPEDARRKPGSVGRPLPDAQIKILDAARNEVKQGEVGEIFSYIAGVTDFTYHNRPDERAAAAHGDFISVGDAGWIDEDGYLFLADRKRDMVISGGVNIYPAEIEMVLIGMPGVRDCAVFGLPDPEFGEHLCACIQPDGPPPTAEAVRAFLGQYLAKFKLPKRVEIVSEMPREDSGKIFKRKLRERYL